MNTTKWTIAGLITLGLVYLAWFIFEADEKITKTTGSLPVASHYAQDLIIHHFNQSGIPEFRIQSPEMRYYPVEELMEFDHPVAWKIDSSTDSYKLTADQALADTLNETILLSGQVTLEHQNTVDDEKFSVSSKTLQLHPANGTLETTESVVMKGPQLTINAVGMWARLNEPRQIKLLNQVRARYEPL